MDKDVAHDIAIEIDHIFDSAHYAEHTSKDVAETMARNSATRINAHPLRATIVEHFLGMEDSQLTGNPGA